LREAIVAANATAAADTINFSFGAAAGLRIRPFRSITSLRSKSKAKFWTVSLNQDRNYRRSAIIANT
jgi:hypothetical protein